ncbi:hypothetical protein HK105_206902 [Polyrhizophydium stewartii]|uniref:4'-phosphopantetheinyl transferase domain-containing protein n=1 Tax=Polyrhizophydium stewartii TaxID=2732419 RepID=A0ABR4N277_9FUNG
MPVVGVGVDIVQAARIGRLLQRQSPLRFARRMLAPREVEMLMAAFEQHAESLHQPLALGRAAGSALPARPAAARGDAERLMESAAPWERRLVDYLGTRWAIKEAAFKAMYPRMHLDWHQVVVAKSAGKPFLEIAGADGVRGHVSVSHDAGLVVAMVVLEELRE